MTDSTPPLTSRSRIAVFLATLALMAAVAAVTWTTAAPESPATEIIAVEAAAAAMLPTLAAIVPTPAITPGPGNGGRTMVLADGPAPTPTLVPTLTLAPTEAAAALSSELPTMIAPTAVPSTETTPPTAVPGTEPPQRPSVNGVPYESIIVMPPDVVQRAQAIYAAGKVLGRNPRAYSKVGDSTTENPHFLARYDTGPYDLGQYASLQPVVDYYLGSHGRDSVAVRVGMHAWTANDPAWADESVCLANESPVICEIRLNNPGILLIRLGTNDVGVPGIFDSNIRQIVETAIAGGVIPVIGTKADRHEGSNENNDILRRVAADYRIPLWDFDAVANTLPGRGLDQDASHMLTFYSHDFNDPTAFSRGHAMHNLTALMMLDAIWRDVMLGGQ